MKLERKITISIGIIIKIKDFSLISSSECSYLLCRLGQFLHYEEKWRVPFNEERSVHEANNVAILEKNIQDIDIGIFFFF